MNLEIDRTTYQIVSKEKKCEVYATANGKKIGGVFVGSEQAAKQFVGQKIGGLTLVNGRLVDTRIEIKHEDTQRMRFLKKLAAK
jgi:flagellar basal body P-ring protein FlgI